MPDVTTYIRPDVTIAAAVPATVPHARLVNYTNAVQVAMEATDRGQVNVTVGVGINTNVTLGTTTTVGAGNSTTVVSGAGAPGMVGGALNITAGAGGAADGGTVTITGGAVGVTPGGRILVGGGVAVGPVAGAVTIQGGTAPAGNGGAITLTAGRSDGAGVGGAITITSGQAAGGVTGAVNISTPAPDGGANAAGAIAVTVGNSSGATAGSAITLTTGAAGVGSGLNGGNIVLAPGAGDGAGTRGVVVVSAATASAIRPSVTGLVALGTGTLAYSATYTRSVQAETGANFVINRADGTTWATLNNGAIATIGYTTRFNDAVVAYFGNGSDAGWVWSTSNANNAVMLVTNVNSAAQSGNIILTTAANLANEHGLAAVAQPRLAIFSNADMSVAGNRTQYIQMYHDGSSGQIGVGTGRIVFNASIQITNATAQLTNSDSTAGIGFATNIINLNANTNATARQVINASTTGSPTFLTFTQPANTANTPVGLLFTAGAHTTLTAAEVFDVDWNLNRTVNFTTGGLMATQRAFRVQAPTYSASAPTQTITDAATFYVSGAPQTSGGNVSLTNTWTIWVDAGNCRFDGNIRLATNGSAIQMIRNSGSASINVMQITAGTDRLDVSGPLSSVGSPIIRFLNSGGSTLAEITGDGQLALTPLAVAGGATPTGFTYTGAAHTMLPASTECTDVNWNLNRAVQFSTGALALQRAVRIQAPTYEFVGASTLTDAVTFNVSGAPAAGTNATITRRWTATFGVLEATVRTPTIGSVGVFGAGTVDLLVRDTTNDVEGILTAGATGVLVGAATNHSVLITVNNATVITVGATTLTFADAVNMVFNTTTGTKIGTGTSQKLAFYNATPIVQGASVADPVGGAIIDVEARAAITDLISRIEATGLIAT